MDIDQQYRRTCSHNFYSPFLQSSHAVASKVMPCHVKAKNGMLIAWSGREAHANTANVSTPGALLFADYVSFTKPIPDQAIVCLRINNGSILQQSPPFSRTDDIVCL